MGVTFTTTDPAVTFTGSDGRVSFTPTDPAVTFTSSNGGVSFAAAPSTVAVFTSTGSPVSFTTVGSVTFTAGDGGGTGGGSTAAPTEVFRSDLYLSIPVGDVGATVNATELDFGASISALVGTRIMINNVADDPYRGVYEAVADNGSGFDTGVWVPVADEEQPYVTGHQNLVGSFGQDLITGQYTIGSLRQGSGWGFVPLDFYVPADDNDWSNPSPRSLALALDRLAAVTGEINGSAIIDGGGA